MSENNHYLPFSSKSKKNNGGYKFLAVLGNWGNFCPHAKIIRNFWKIKVDVIKKLRPMHARDVANEKVNFHQ